MVSAHLYPESTLIIFLLVKVANGDELRMAFQHQALMRVAVEFLDISLSLPGRPRANPRRVVVVFSNKLRELQGCDVKCINKLISTRFVCFTVIATS